MTNEELSELTERARELAQRVHETYERLAWKANYKTPAETAVPWEQLPERNRNIWEAVCVEVIPTMFAVMRQERAIREAEHFRDKVPGQITAHAVIHYPDPEAQEEINHCASLARKFAEERLAALLAWKEEA